MSTTLSPSIDPLDSVIRIVTPENIAFEYRLAGPFRRSVAYLIDAVIVISVVAAVLIIALLLLRSSSSIGVFLIAYFLLKWGYGGVFETYWNGQTPGKRMMKIRVVSTDGLPINGQQAVLRNFLRVADSFYYFLVGALAFLLSRRFQRLGDLAAGTMVVLEESHSLHNRYQPPEIPEALAELIPRSFPIDEMLGDAIGGYIARRMVLPAARRLQLAGVLVDALRTRFDLPEDVNADLVLCELYRRYANE